MYCVALNATDELALIKVIYHCVSETMHGRVFKKVWEKHYALIPNIS